MLSGRGRGGGRGGTTRTAALRLQTEAAASKGKAGGGKQGAIGSRASSRYRVKYELFATCYLLYFLACRSPARGSPRTSNSNSSGGARAGSTSTPPTRSGGRSSNSNSNASARAQPSPASPKGGAKKKVAAKSAAAAAVTTKPAAGELASPAEEAAPAAEEDSAPEEPAPAPAAAPAPVRRPKLPRLNDNPDAPEVVDVPRLLEKERQERSEATNGAQEAGGPLVNGEAGAGGVMPLLTGQEEASDQPAAAPNNNKAEAKAAADTIVVIPLSDENFASATDSSDEGGDGVTKDGKKLNGPSDTDGDLLTKMIRDNLNKAVNTSGDGVAGGDGVGDIKQSLLNAIKNTLKSSNTKPKADDGGFHDGGEMKTDEILSKVEEVMANGNIVNGDHETDGKDAKSELEKPGDNTENKDNEDNDDDDKENSKTDLIEKAEFELNLEPVQETSEEPLTASADGINDLLVDIKTNVPHLSSAEDQSKDEVPENNSNVTISLDQLDAGMLPVDSVQIEHIEADGAAQGSIGDLQLLDVPNMSESNISVVVTPSPKLNIDKSKLFSQMNDTFAKDTHKALKNRPVYQKRPRQSPPSSESASESTQLVSPPSKKKKLKPGKMKKLKPESNIKEDEEEKEEMDEDVDDPPPPVLTKNTDESAEEKTSDLAEPPDLGLKPLVFSCDGGNITLSNKPESKEPSKEDESPEEKVLNSKEEFHENEEEQSPVNEQQMDVDKNEEVPTENSESCVNNDINVPDQTEDKLTEEVSEETSDPTINITEADDKICDNNEESVDTKPVPKEEDEDVKDVAESAEADNKPSVGATEDTKPAVTHQPSPPTNSELTKSLRQIRLNKKSPTKTPSKAKPVEDEEDSDEEAVRPKLSSSPVKDLSASSSSMAKAGTEVFDFTDEEDLPLNNIDLDVLAGGEAEAVKILAPDPDPQPTLDHELTQLPPVSSSSPTKLASVRTQHLEFEMLEQSRDCIVPQVRPQVQVSPQVLSVSDAVAAVAALQVAGAGAGAARQLNGDTQSDDTDTSVTKPGHDQTHGRDKGKLAKRKKRRVTESDEGGAVCHLNFSQLNI